MYYNYNIYTGFWNLNMKKCINISLIIVYWLHVEMMCVCACVCVCLVTQSYSTFCNPIDCSLPGSFVHGILQERILQSVAIPFSRGSSQPRDWIWVSCIAGGFFTVWATPEALISILTTVHSLFCHPVFICLCRSAQPHCKVKLFLTFNPTVRWHLEQPPHLPLSAAFFLIKKKKLLLKE